MCNDTEGLDVRRVSTSRAAIVFLVNHCSYFDPGGILHENQLTKTDLGFVSGDTARTVNAEMHRGKRRWPNLLVWTNVKLLCDGGGGGGHRATQSANEWQRVPVMFSAC